MRVPARIAIAGARGRRLPRPAWPEAQARTYSSLVRRVVGLIRASMASVIPGLRVLVTDAGLVRGAVADSTPNLRVLFTDAPLPGLSSAESKVVRQVSSASFRAAIRTTARDVAAQSGGDLTRRLEFATKVAIEPIGREPWLAARVEAFTKENVKLISSIPERFFGELQTELSSKIAGGARWETLAATIEERYDVSESRAELIARDQVGKFSANLNKERLEALGVDRFVWRSVRDERVRDTHAQYDGNTYTWPDAPDGGPGQAVQCRCYADPVL